MIVNQNEIVKPVFNSTKEYRKALNEFYQSLIPEFEKQDIARRKSETFARQKMV